MLELTGGRAGQIWRDDDAVVRPAGVWTPTVHRFLRHLRERDFSAAPLPLGLADGQERVSYVEGQVSEALSDPSTGSLAMLRSAAALLRRFHAASRGFLESDLQEKRWMLPPQAPNELVCHGDFAPYNVATIGTTAVGIIDFDAAHPAPALWDLAYAVYRWAPLSDPSHEGVVFATEEQLRRARLFCDAYGMTAEQRTALPDMMLRRLRALVDFILAEAGSGPPPNQKDGDAGDSAIYIKDMDYIVQIGDRLRPILCD